MKNRPYMLFVIPAALAAVFALGCDGEVFSTSTTKMNGDGSSSSRQQATTESTSGTVTVTQVKSTTAAPE